LKDRKLYVPRGLEVPDILNTVTETIATRAVLKAWDRLVRGFFQQA
jgi:hypothetical protein